MTHGSARHRPSGRGSHPSADITPPDLLDWWQRDERSPPHFHVLSSLARGTKRLAPPAPMAVGSRPEHPTHRRRSGVGPRGRRSWTHDGRAQRTPYSRGTAATSFRHRSEESRRQTPRPGAPAARTHPDQTSVATAPHPDPRPSVHLPPRRWLGAGPHCPRACSLAGLVVLSVWSGGVWRAEGYRGPSARPLVREGTTAHNEIDGQGSPSFSPRRDAKRIVHGMNGASRKSPWILLHARLRCGEILRPGFFCVSFRPSLPSNPEPPSIHPNRGRYSLAVVRSVSGGTRACVGSNQEEQKKPGHPGGMPPCWVAAVP